MKKQLLKSALIAVAGVGLLAGSALATSLSYWTLSEFQAGTDGTANLGITVDAAYANVTFGFFTTNDTFTLIDKKVDIFENEDLVGYTAVANFIFDNTTSDYDLQLTVKDGLGKIVRSNMIDDFGSVFGFYYIRDWANPDREIYSDSKFDINPDSQSMFIIYDELNNDASVHLLVGCETKYAINVSDVQPVPEPATFLLFGAGIAGLAGIARRKKINKA